MTCSIHTYIYICIYTYIERWKDRFNYNNIFIEHRYAMHCKPIEHQLNFYRVCIRSQSYILATDEIPLASTHYQANTDRFPGTWHASSLGKPSALKPPPMRAVGVGEDSQQSIEELPKHFASIATGDSFWNQTTGDSPYRWCNRTMHKAKQKSTVEIRGMHCKNPSPFDKPKSNRRIHRLSIRLHGPACSPPFPMRV